MVLEGKQKAQVLGISKTNDEVDGLVLDLENGGELHISTNQNQNLFSARVVTVEVKP